MLSFRDPNGIHTIYGCELHNIQGNKWIRINTMCNDVNGSKQKHTQFHEQKQKSTLRRYTGIILLSCIYTTVFNWSCYSSLCWWRCKCDLQSPAVTTWWISTHSPVRRLWFSISRSSSVLHSKSMRFLWNLGILNNNVFFSHIKYIFLFIDQNVPILTPPPPASPNITQWTVGLFSYVSMTASYSLYSLI